MFSSIADGWPRLACVWFFNGRVSYTGLNLVFCSSIGKLAQAGLCSVVLQDGWLVFSSITRWLAQASLCSVVLQDGWPRLACVVQ